MYILISKYLKINVCYIMFELYLCIGHLKINHLKKKIQRNDKLVKHLKFFSFHFFH